LDRVGYCLGDCAGDPDLAASCGVTKVNAGGTSEEIRLRAA
jgi:hypothetical protein